MVRLTADGFPQLGADGQVVGIEGQAGQEEVINFRMTGFTFPDFDVPTTD